MMCGQSHHRGSDSSTSTPLYRQPASQSSSSSADRQQSDVAQPVSRQNDVSTSTGTLLLPAATNTTPQLATVDARPARAGAAVTDAGVKIDNVNEGHNNYVILTSSPGSPGHRQAQVGTRSQTRSQGSRTQG